MRSNHRLVALDHLRGFVVALVVLHHAMLAYCRFDHIDRHHYLLSTAPVVDGQRWGGFDALVILNDGFFMPLMFLLSGLFVWPGLRRRGARAYLRSRALRLGVPFVVTALTVVPLAYYPSWLQAGGAPGLLRFWAGMVTIGPWPSGPPWFIAVLLAFDAAAALAFTGGHRWFQAPSARVTPAPRRAFALFLACLLLAYLPGLAVFGPARWISLGPLAVQGSRIGLYAVSFAAGVVLGAGGLTEGAAPFRAALVRGWPRWALLAAGGGTVLVATQATWSSLGSTLPAWVWLIAYGTVLPGFCAAACLAAPAICLRFAGGPNRVWTSLGASSYGIYLLHYPVVTWMQFGLLHVPLGAIGKAGVTFAVALPLSWAMAALLRLVPGAVPAG